MKRTPKNKEFSESDKAAALTALAAGTNPPPEGCLTPGELAALVDKRCSPKEQAGFLKHVAECQECYDAWLAVSQTVGQNEKGQLIKGPWLKKLTSGKLLAAAGTALAAAASVVLYMNISTESRLETVAPMIQKQPIKKTAARLPKPHQAQEEQGPMLAETNMEEEFDAAQSPMAPEPMADSAITQQEPEGKIQAKQKQLAKPKAFELSPSGDVAIPKERMNDLAAITPRKELAPLHNAMWLAKIQTACADEKTPISFWRTKEQELRQTFARRKEQPPPAPGSTQEKEHHELIELYKIITELAGGAAPQAECAKLDRLIKKRRQ